MNNAKNNRRQKTAGAIALISLALAAFPNASGATPKATFSEGTLIAQSTNCRAIDPEVGLNVYQAPNGQVIGTADSEQNVYLTDGEVRDGWVQIQSPIIGYVRADLLTYCNETPNTVANPEGEAMETVAGSNCRQVISSQIDVRQEPGGEVVATLEESQEVFIANEGQSGWVPIEAPANGFVLSSELGYCDGEVSQTVTPVVNPEGPVAVSQPPIGTGCRQVNVGPSLEVRETPDGNIIGSVEKDAFVYITDEGYQGWVPITKPMDGYVRSDDLTYCP